MRPHLILPTSLLLLGAACSGTESPSTDDVGNPGGSTATAGRDSMPPSFGGSGARSGSGGSGGSGTSAGSSSTGGSGGSSGSVGEGGTGAIMPSVDACPTPEIAPTPLRRLTRFEYANTVRDLLAVDAAVAADLPADEVTNGFDNNSAILTVSALHAEKYILISESLAKTAVQNLAALTASCDTASNGEEACALEFAKRFGRRAFRRPTTAADEQILMTAFTAGRNGADFSRGIEVMIRAALQSPHFIYRLETTSPADAAAKLVPLSQFELATRLSYLIWASAPDDALLDAAAANALATPAAIAAKAREMLASPKAKGAISNFFNQWASTTRLGILTKNTEVFPKFSTELRDAMARELPAFVDYVLFTGDHKLSTFLTSNVGFVNKPLAELYGMPAAAIPTGASTQMVTHAAEQGRAGLLTQAGFLSVQGHPDQTSPVLRGKFVRSMLLCDPPSLPPDDVDISVPEVDEGATARVRFAAHLEAGNTCNGCHVLMDPIGFAFEKFDALGQYREMENQQVIDVSGEIFDAVDPALGGAFVGVQEMAQKLANSDQVRDCVATQWFRYASGRREVQPDACSLGTLQASFGSSEGDLVELIVGITQTDAFLNRRPVTQ
jgi:hypothetical protein